MGLFSRLPRLTVLLQKLEKLGPKNIGRIIITIIIGAVYLGALVLILGSFWGIPIMSAGIALFCFSLTAIPANPPHLGLVTLLGKRVGEVKKEGWRILLAPFYDVILIPVGKINFDLPAEIVRTPDRVELEIPISITFTPGTSEEIEVFDENGKPEKTQHPDRSLINYLNSGKEQGVKNIISDVIRERVRQWAMDPTEGPRNAQEALAAREEASWLLIKTAAGESIERIPSKIPTEFLRRYFEKRTIDTNQKEWEEEQRKSVEKQIEELPPDEKNNIEKAIKKRKAIVDKLRAGNGVQPLSHLGITLNRLNIGEIRFKPGTAYAEVADKEAKEKQEMHAETLELRHVRDRIKELMEIGFSPEDARDIVQMERDKGVKREIKDIRGFDLKSAAEVIGRLFGTKGEKS